MIKASELLDGPGPADLEIHLPYEFRQKSRFRYETGDLVLGFMLPRGTLLRDGDRVKTEDGRIVTIKAADESLTEARARDELQWARACYHLGNRHVPVQIMVRAVRIQPDEVLNAMLSGLGLTIIHIHGPFEPEAGAFHQHEHR